MSVSHQGPKLLSVTLTGFFSEERLREILDIFIDKYVKCASCKLPELTLEIHKQVYGKCKACGNSSKLDNNHKIAKLMIKDSAAKINNASQAVGNVDKTNDPKPIKKEHNEKENAKDNDVQKNPRDNVFDNLTEDKPIPPPLKLNKAHLDVFITRLRDELQQYQKSKPLQMEEIQTFIYVAKSFSVLSKRALSYVVFQSIFSVNIANEIGHNKILLLQCYNALEIRKKKLELLLNLEYFVNTYFKLLNIPKILTIFYEQELFTKKFLTKLISNEYDDMAEHDFRYIKEVDEPFKIAARALY